MSTDTTYRPTTQQVEREQSSLELEIRELKARLADLEEWVAELADDMLDRTEGVR